MSRIFVALLLVTLWPDGQAQSSLPRCPADKPVFQWTDCVASITFPDGEEFFGEYQDGKRNGMGRYTFKDGGQYVGQWRDGKRDGEGIRYKPDGTIQSSGLWKDGAFDSGREIEKSRYPFNAPRYPIVSDVDPGATNLVMSASIGFLSDQQQSSLPRCASPQLPQQWTDCYGTETYPNGAKYVGEWHGGQRDGYGVMTFPDGTIFTGEFESGNREGKGSLAYKNGTVFFGYFERDAASSIGMFVYPNGQRYIGEVKDLYPPYQKSVSQRYFGEYSDDHYE